MSDTDEVRDGDEEKQKKGSSKIRSLLGKGLPQLRPLSVTCISVCTSILATRFAANEVFPQLTLYRGREKLSRSKSTLVVGLLYISHSFSAWVRSLHLHVKNCLVERGRGIPTVYLYSTFQHFPMLILCKALLYLMNPSFQPKLYFHTSSPSSRVIECGALLSLSS